MPYTAQGPERGGRPTNTPSNNAATNARRTHRRVCHYFFEAV
jgi:hypothetical protein